MQLLTDIWSRKKIYFFTVFLVTILACQKEGTKEITVINSQDFLAKISDHTKFEKLQRSKLNDSTYRIKGEVGTLQVTGFLTQDDKKIDWWKIIDSNNDKKLFLIEYRLVDNKEFANQYKIFSGSELDIYKSKYYSVKFEKDKVSYSFNVPKIKGTVRTQGTFSYIIYNINENKKVISSKSHCLNIDNRFECTFSVPGKNKFLVLGVFWELSQIQDGKMVGSEIYVRDTL